MDVAGNNLRNYLIEHSLQIGLLTFAGACLFGSIHYEYCLNSEHDFVFWMGVIEGFFQETLFLPTLSVIVMIFLKFQIFSLTVVYYLVASFYSDERRMEKYADFIVRRLLAQLECAISKCENCPEEANEGYIDVQDIFIAINLFRRDVRKILDRPDWFNPFLGDFEYLDVFFISDQEEEELKQMGYEKLDVEVNMEFLLDLNNTLTLC